jgi:hypothetical protein
MQATWVHSFGLAYSVWMKEEEEKLLPLGKEVLEGVLCLKFGQHVPLAWREPAKISKLLLADLCCNTLNKVNEIFVFQQKLPTCKTIILY